MMIGTKQDIGRLGISGSVLESMIEEINEYWGDENQTPTPSETHRMNR